MVVALTGCMGSGKSTVGRALADMLGCRFIDLDEAIVKKAGKTIPEIFSSEGEAGFRRIELKTLKAVLPESGTVVLALGGGTLTVPEAAALIHEKTCCIYLRASVDTLAERLAPEAEGRPLLKDGNIRERIAALMDARGEIYEKTAHAVIDTDGMDPSDIAEELILSYL